MGRRRDDRHGLPRRRHAVAARARGAGRHSRRPARALAPGRRRGGHRRVQSGKRDPRAARALPRGRRDPREPGRAGARRHRAEDARAAASLGEAAAGNIRPLTRWRAAVDAGTLPVETSERLTPRQRLAERLILGLRTSDGVPAAWLAERTASEPALARRIDEWERARHLVADGARVRLTDAGLILSAALFGAL